MVAYNEFEPATELEQADVSMTSDEGTVARVLDFANTHAEGISSRCLTAAGVAYLYNRKGYQSADNPEGVGVAKNHQDDIVVVLTVRVPKFAQEEFEAAETIWWRRHEYLGAQRRAENAAKVDAKRAEIARLQAEIVELEGAEG